MSAMTPARLQEIKDALEEVQGHGMTQDECDMQDELYRALTDLLGPQPEPAPTKFLFLIERPEAGGYDTYRSAVVCAYREEDARYIHPAEAKDYHVTYHGLDCRWERNGRPLAENNWIQPDQVIVTKIGVAGDDIRNRSVVISDFHEA